jgi:hypothetical protein
MIWLVPHFPPTVGKLSLFLSFIVCRQPNLVTGEGEGVKSYDG